VYTRLGLYPNLDRAWVTAYICRPGRASVAIVDFSAALPAGEELRVEREGLLVEHHCLSALDRFRVHLDAVGEAFDDPSAPLRGEPGAPVAAAFDLVWETDGAPYAYRVATRYEIPCRVSGSVHVGDQRIELSGAGQRDHSWGPRDWWSADWVWSAGHLDDGTRFHAVEFRLPGAPPVGLGYVQPPQGELVEPQRVSASEQIAPGGLIGGARIICGELALDVAPLAFGPLRLESPDGRLSHFPRAMCKVLAADGRAGLAWVEWNRNVAR
jgi:hypothetical protein